MNLFVQIGMSLLVMIFALSQVNCTTSYTYRTTSHWVLTRSSTRPAISSQQSNSGLFTSSTPSRGSHAPPASSTHTVVTSTNSATSSSKTTTTSTTTTTTTTITTPTSPLPESSKHFQMIMNKNYSEVKNFYAIQQELKTQLAAMSGVSVERVKNIVLQEVKSSSVNKGKLAVTFDVQPRINSWDRPVSDAFNKFSRNVTSDTTTVKIEGKETKPVHYFVISWKDDDDCGSVSCNSTMRCWRLEWSRECVCKECPRMPNKETPTSSGNTGLTTTNIIVIIVVVAVVALIIIIIVIVCVLRSSKNNDDEKFEGSQYSTDSEERYNTSFAN